MAKAWVRNKVEIENIRQRLGAATALVQNLSVAESHIPETDFNTHKALNILYKELVGNLQMIDCMSGRITKTKLRQSKPEVQEPQSRKVFLKGY